MPHPMQHPFLQKTLPIDWPKLTPEHIEPDITRALKDAQENIDALANHPPEEPSFESTFLSLEKATEDLNRAWGKVNHLDSVCNAEALRKAHHAMLPKVTAFYAQIPLNEKLWDVLKIASKAIDIQTLSPSQARFVQETLNDFVECGADLPPEKKARFRELEEELAQLTQKFSENVLDATNAWELVIEDETKLAGLPETAREEARQSALAKGYGSEEAPKWRFTLQMPSVIAVMTYMDDEKIRRQVWEAQTQIGRKEPFENNDLIVKILALRNEKAQLLGKENFADLILERRMAGSGNEALSFINDLHSKVYDAFRREEKELETFKAKTTDAKPEHLEPWEAGYWAEKQRKALYAFEEEEVREYFPFNLSSMGSFHSAKSSFTLTLAHSTPPCGTTRLRVMNSLMPQGNNWDFFIQTGTHEKPNEEVHGWTHSQRGPLGTKITKNLTLGGFLGIYHLPPETSLLCSRTVKSKPFSRIWASTSPFAWRFRCKVALRNSRLLGFC